MNRTHPARWTVVGCLGVSRVELVALQDNGKNKTEEQLQAGLIEDDDVAEQMEAQDFTQPQAQQPELQLPEDINLSDDAMEEDTDGDDPAAEPASQEMQQEEEDEPSTAADPGAVATEYR